jgi:hypothetical protein
MEEKRQRRRRDKVRMKARSRWIYGRIKSTRYGWDESEYLDWLKRCERWADNIKVCSCSGCGNPRRSGWNKKERITMQERRFLCDDGE